MHKKDESIPVDIRHIEKMKISLLPALNGDCILVEYQPSRFILIDGGYVDTYSNYLLPKLKEIKANGGVIDLLVVTHIDGDHISGIVRLLEEELPISIGSVWYNGYRHIQSPAIVSKDLETFVHSNICKSSTMEEVKPVSARQGCTLSTLIMSHNLPWNSPSDGKCLMAPMTVSMGDTKIHILTPNKNDILNLENYWKKSLIKNGLLSKAHSGEYWDDAYEFSLSKEKPGFRFHEKKVSKSCDLLKIREEEYVPDSSATNGSSFSFVLDSDGKRILFLGDAHAETVLNALINLYGDENKPYWFDAVKLSHHGSYSNNSPELLNMIRSDKWMISTNGLKYNHPDMPTLAHIITNDEHDCKRLYFNYKLDIGVDLMREMCHKDYDFEIVMPEEENGITITI